MLQSKLIGETKKEWPNEATLKSHGLLLKGGYIKQMASGIYTFLPLARKVSLKVENIIREEMNALGAQEILMPLVATKTLWNMSNRYNTVGSELLRFKDRNGNDMVLSMTHEEATVFSMLNEASSYQKYPFSVFQIQTKFRDEARSRGGLIRTREFTMKDAYSFHTTLESLDEEYDKFYMAYNKIFKRVGLKNVIAVKSDTGMMGGSMAHEYMLLCDAGEDKIVTCSNCNYSANMEVAYTNKIDAATIEKRDLEYVETPDINTIEKLSEFLNLDASKLGKAVIYERLDTKQTIIVFLRADREVNETKLRNLLLIDDEDLVPKKPLDTDNIAYGYVGPVDLNACNVTVLYDKSLENEQALVFGANKKNYHLKNVNIKRDVKDAKFVDVSKVEKTDYCPVCGKKALNITNGIEVGNIFKLGDKYTKMMKMTYLDETGKEKTPIMGCYGIGVGRLIASVIEERATMDNINWPVSIAPFDIHILPLDYTKNDEVKNVSDKLYNMLSKKYEVLLDDRKKSLGVKLKDADLIASPIKIIISPRNLKENKLELKIALNEQEFIDIDDIESYISLKQKELFENLNKEEK